MIEQLTGQKRELAALMSDISEEAYCAGWMEHLEFDLWSAVKNGPIEYGRIYISDEIIDHLKKLSEEIKGWIFFDAENEEEFIRLKEWIAMYDKRNT